MVQTGLNHKYRSMKTDLFAVFDSQKSKDWTAGPVFSSLGLVWLRSFCGLETGLTNTRQTLLGTMFCGMALDEIASFLSLLLYIDNHVTHLGFGCR